MIFLNRIFTTVKINQMKTYILLFITSICFVNCSYQRIENIAPLENTIEIGNKFCVNLPENHTTGYMWLINNTFDDKVLDYSGSVFRGNEKGVDFNFTAIKKGKATLNFTLIKYHDTSDVKQFIIDVK